MNRRIEITVAPNGTTRLETRGFTGSSCQDASEFLEKALGHTTNEQRKTEFFTPASTTNHLHQNNGG